MNSDLINLFDSQYRNEGGSWNKETCYRNGQIETYSGPGSLLENTDCLIYNLNKFITDNNIKTIMDVPCGDFNFMSKLNLDNVIYIGCDVSKLAIGRCIEKNTKSNTYFKVFDLLNDELHYSDLIIVKDLFLENVKSSKCKYFATSRHNKGRGINKDQQSGLGAREIEITKEPFNFNFPLIYSFNSSYKELPDYCQDEIIIFEMIQHY
jgi:hypothetical protein